MKIFIINQYAVPPTEIGGTRHYNLAKELIKNGNEVTLVASNYNHFSLQFVNQSRDGSLTDDSNNVPFVWIPVPGYRGNTVKRFFNMLVFAWRILFNKSLKNQQPDIIIGSTPQLFSAFSSYLLAKRFNVPFVLEVRDLWPETLIHLSRINKKHPLILLMKVIEKYLYCKADFIITLLPAAAEYLVGMGVARKKICWLPNAVNLSELPINDKLSENEKLVFMYAGSHGIANDLDKLIDAALLLQQEGWDKHIKILLIGDGAEKLRLMQRAADLKIKLLEFQNPVPKSEIYHKLNTADVFLVLLKDSPLYRWGISLNKIFDYFAMARPVIFAADLSYNPVSLANAGLVVPPNNPKVLAEAIKQMAKLSAQDRLLMGRKGKDYILKNHNVSDLAQKLHRLLNDIVKNTYQTVC